MPYQVEWLRLRIALNRTTPRPLEHALTESHGLSHGYLAWQMFLSQKFITKFLSHGYMTLQMFLVRRVSWLWFKETLEWILSGSFTGWGYWWRVFWGSEDEFILWHKTMRIQDILTNLGIYLVTIPERESVVLFYH